MTHRPRCHRTHRAVTTTIILKATRVAAPHRSKRTSAVAWDEVLPKRSAVNLHKCRPRRFHHPCHRRMPRRLSALPQLYLLCPARVYLPRQHLLRRVGTRARAARWRTSTPAGWRWHLTFAWFACARTLRQYVSAVYCTALGSGSARTGLQAPCPLYTLPSVLFCWPSLPKCPLQAADVAAVKGVRRAMDTLFPRSLVNASSCASATRVTSEKQPRTRHAEFRR
jgi:hypothetical protein